jgi:hypothetical protein
LVEDAVGERRKAQHRPARLAARRDQRRRFEPVEVLDNDRRVEERRAVVASPFSAISTRVLRT